MRSSGWFVRFKPNRAAAVRLFCLHYAGGNSTAFHGWAESLAEGVELIAIELPGRRTRFREVPLESAAAIIEPLYREVRPLLERPFVLFGYSIGALLAYELARKLEAAGDPMPLELIVCAARAPHLPRVQRNVAQFGLDEWRELLVSFDGIAPEVLRDDELMSVLIPMLKADFNVGHTYSEPARQPLCCPVTAFGGRRDTWVSEAELAAWRSATRARFEYELFDGGHFFLKSHRAELLQHLRQRLDACLAEVRSGAATLRADSAAAGRRP